MTVVGFPVLVVDGLVDFVACALCFGFRLALLFASSSLAALPLRCATVAALVAARAEPLRRSDLAEEERAARFTLTDMGKQPILVQGFLPALPAETISNITPFRGGIQLCAAATMPQAAVLRFRCALAMIRDLDKCRLLKEFCRVARLRDRLRATDRRGCGAPVAKGGRAWP
jgi:hypothetical protein